MIRHKAAVVSSQYAPMLQSALQRQWFQCVCGYDTYEMTLLSVEYQHSIAPRCHPVSVCVVCFTALLVLKLLCQRVSHQLDGSSRRYYASMYRGKQRNLQREIKKFTEGNKEIYRRKQRNLQREIKNFTEGNKEIYRRKQRNLQTEIKKFTEGNKEIYRRKQRNLQRETKKFTDGNKEMYRRKQRNLQRETKKFTEGKQGNNLQRENKEIYRGK